MLTADAFAGRVLRRIDGVAEPDPATLDPALYARRLGFAPDPWQVELLRSSSKRTLLNVTRQGGKSSVTALKTLHKAKYKPGAQILLLSPSERQSKELMLKIKEFYRASDLRAESDTVLTLILPNKSRIIALPSKEGTIRGYGGIDLLVIDEAARVTDEFYYSVLPMLAVSNGDLALLSTPFGKRGFFFDEWDHGDDWHRIEVPATQCPRISAQFLAEMKRKMGDWWFKQEYMCEFMDAETSAFSYEDVQAAMSEKVDTWTL